VKKRKLSQGLNVRLAGLVAALSLALALLQAAIPAEEHPRAKPTLPRYAGQQTFLSHCAVCHGADGQGGEHAGSIARGRARALSDQALFAIIRRGIPAKGMPAFNSLATKEILALVAYLRELQGATPSAAANGDPVRGRDLFFGRAQCSSCHAMQGQGSFLATDLSDFALLHPPAAIERAILHPDKQGALPKEFAVVTMPGGDEYRGVILNEDNFSLQLQDARGEFHLLMKAQAARISRSLVPPMPTDYSRRLSKQEIADLVSYIAGEHRAANSHRRPKEESTRRAGVPPRPD
jgi:cytochrome c oxidase cbb3-type subunit 3